MCPLASVTMEVGPHLVPSSTDRGMPSGDTARLGDGTVWTAERMKLNDSSIPSDARDNLDYSSDPMENASVASEHPSDST